MTTAPPVLRTFRPALVGLLLFGSLISCSATGQSAQPTYSSAEDCIQDQELMEMTGCQDTGDGWVKMGQQPGPNGMMGGFIAFAFFWSAIPMVAGGLVASSRGQSVGIAVLLGLVLGWLGLLIVVLVMKPEVTTAARSMIERNGQPKEPLFKDPQRKSAAVRLSELTDLKASGLITEDEFQTRRAAILEEI